MVMIKDAAVPHYSKYNGKIVFAVRVCPANLGVEPYTVYRRWDEFLDLSAKLATVFPSASPDPSDPSAIFRRIPRLSRKVTLFPTSSTHSNRRDELDLFVRHLVSLPKAVTSFPLVREFFGVKMNGLDGRQPPSPTASPSPSSTSQFGSGEASPQLNQNSAQTSYFSIDQKPLEQSSNATRPQLSKKKSSKQLLQPAQIYTPAQSASLSRSFRPTLTAKRSTPDLRRFMAASTSSPEEEPPLPSASSAAVLYPTLDKFSFPPRRAPECPRTPGTASPLASSSSPASSVKSPMKRPSTRPSSWDEYVSSIISTNDNASTRTASTVRPSRAGSTSRMASPMSFVSVTSEDSARAIPMPSFPLPPSTPRNAGSSKTSSGPAPSLRHFRSLQDIRNVLSPHPQLPILDTSVQPSYVPSTQKQHSPAVSSPPQTPQSSSSATFPLSSPFASQGMTRSRSDSKILLTTALPSLAEDEVVSPVSSPLTRQPSTGRKAAASPAAPGMSRSLSADSVTAGSYPTRRPSVNSVRRMQHNLAMTPTTRHQASSSISSLASTDSSSSPSLSRSQASSAGLGLGFSSSSRDSLEFSDHTSSTMDSPDSSLIIHSPVTPLSATASEKADPFDKLFHWQQHEILQNGLNNNGHLVCNAAPPLPFFPTPAMADQMQATNLSRRNSAANRRRASSLHQPVLETIIGSPVLGTEAIDLSPTVTLKIMTESTNFMLKVAKSASLKEVKTKVSTKMKSSGVTLDKPLALAVIANATPSSDSTAKGSKLLNTKASSAVDASHQQVDLEDEQDWLLAVSLASTKITLRVI
ncbi:hypothetical protein P389DRAFT_206238 [Cystobasidium minutum MCA 4210]|uniref:uncharacterized protein n=1 Tax=Cystobasidium minutum MCA 4210 TaxID=1397322 RepID=UPI0034CEB65B|eukprot:jgi/Rhomi1/206238/MIX7067_122_98